MKWLLWKLGLIELVWTLDFNGDTRLRVVRGTPERPIVCAILCETTGVLLPDGTIEGGSYMTRWRPYTGFWSRYPQIQWLRP